MAHLYKEDFSEDERREQTIAFLENECQTAAHTIIRKAGVPMGAWQTGFVVSVDKCWCPDSQHVISTETVCPDSERMHVLADHVYCPIHQTQISVRRLLDILPLGKRKSEEKRNALIDLIKPPLALVRAYVFEAGDNYERRALGIDPAEALHSVGPSKKTPLRGCLIEAPTLKRAREIVKDDAIEKPWRDGLHGLLREDLNLPANWHGAPLTIREQTTQADQQWADARARRAERQAEIDRLRRNADRLIIEPL